ncbi:MAG: alpha/beta hydrolase, partial [Burkholderiaceae bacterium]
MQTGNRGVIHPEVQNVLDIFNDLKVPDFYKGSPEQARATFRGLRPDPSTLPPIHRVDNTIIPVNGADIALRIYRPDDSDNLPVLVWFHGGGWVFGDLDSGELACREMAAQAQCAIVNVDYRLAPEHQFPVALEDCIAATHWVIENAGKLSFDINRMAVGGDSAGGNLAASVAQHARDKGISLRKQLLIYPVTQSSFESASYQANATDYFLSLESMRWFWDNYLPDHSQRQDPRVSPLHGQLHGLAPAWI